MRKLSVLSLAALVGVVPIAAVADDGGSDVEFEQDRRWLVYVDTSLASVHDTKRAAKEAAAAAKAERPDADVAFTAESMFVAELSDPPATTTSVSVTTVAPTSTLSTTPASTVPSSPLVWGLDTTAPATDWTKPGLGESYVDPAYGTTVTRLTSADGTRFDRVTYSRRQAENADGSRMMTYHGSATYHVYDRGSGALVAELPIGPDSEPQWHPTDPDRIRFVAQPNSYLGTLQLFEYDLASGTTRTIADLTDRLQSALPGALYLGDRAEGSPSADGNRYAWMVWNAQEQLIGIASYDLATDRILGVLPVDRLPDAGMLDAISMSPTGAYVVTQHYEGTYVYDADLTDERLIFVGAEHSDIAIGADGGDVYVYIDFTAVNGNGGWLMAVDLDTLESTRLIDLYDGTNTSIHISGKGYDKPGWVVASTYNCKVDSGWACDKVMAIELAPDARVLNLAHTYNCGDNYWTETHAVVNRDFSRVYFNSDGGSCGIDAEAMVLDVPAFS